MSEDIRTFIYGSCVSRDTFTHLKDSGFNLVQYVARQSVISSTAPPPSVDPPAFSTPSPFQERMLRGDWAGSLLTELSQAASEIDLVLWDLCDERLGVVRLPGSPGAPSPSYVTRSVDSLTSGLDAQLDRRNRIAFGTLRHRPLFNTAVTEFARHLTRLGLNNKVLLLAPPWALSSVEGTPSPPSFELEARRANRLFKAYHNNVRLLSGVRTASVPQSQALATERHPWGFAPFHYDTSVYLSLAEQIRQFAHARPDQP